MKKFSKILIMILSLALLIGSVVAVGASAEESNTREILAKNVAYTDNVTMLFAVDASLDEAIAGTVKVAYYWEEDGVAVIKEAKLLYPYDENGNKISQYLYEDKYPVYYTEGVPAKELGREVKIVAYTGTLPEDAEFETYSVAEYLYARLYKDGVVNATEGKDVYRKATYENLLAYAASAQELLVNYDSAEKAVLVTDYTYVISTVAGATVNGAQTALFQAGEAEITLSYVGEGTLVGWTVTDLSGEDTEYETSTITVSGVVTVEPIFGVHECSDVDPADHYCDVCGEVVSECADSDDADHNCDLCGAVVSVCEDSSTNGQCNVCGKYIFNAPVVSDDDLIISHVQGNNAKANTAGSLNEVKSSATEDARDDNYKYGSYISIAADPVNAANKVLKFDTNQFTGGGASAPAKITFNTDVADAAYAVFEADVYFSDAIYSSSRYYLDLMYFYIGGTATGTKLTWYQTGTASNENYKLKFAGKEIDAYTDNWVRYQIVMDSANYYAYYSVDGGETYTLIATAAHNAGAVPASILIDANLYYANYEASFDNIVFKSCDSVSVSLADGSVVNYPAN